MALTMSMRERWMMATGRKSSLRCRAYWLSCSRSMTRWVLGNWRRRKPNMRRQKLSVPCATATMTAVIFGSTIRITYWLCIRFLQSRKGTTATGWKTRTVSWLFRKSWRYASRRIRAVIMSFTSPRRMVWLWLPRWLIPVTLSLGAGRFPQVTMWTTWKGRCRGLKTRLFRSSENPVSSWRAVAWFFCWSRWRYPVLSVSFW